MKRLLLLLAFLCLLPSASNAFWKKETKWPTNWRQFKYPPHDEMKPYATIKFTKSIDEACRKYKVASKDYKRADQSYTSESKHYQQQVAFGAILTNSGYQKLMDPYHQKRWRAEALQTSAAVEVLRQWGDPDWKNYSLYSISGVGEKWRELSKSKDRFSASESVFSSLPYSKLRDICD